LPENVEKRTPLIPEQYIPRLIRFIQLLERKEISEDRFIQLLQALIQPALNESMKDVEVKKTLETEVQNLVGKKIWIKAKLGQPWIVEIVPLPEIVRMYTVREEEIKQQNLPGVTYDIQILKDALNGRFNPVLAMMTGKIRVTGLTELMKLSTPLLSAFSPFKSREDLKANLSNRFLNSLDKLLQDVGC